MPVARLCLISSTRNPSPNSRAAACLACCNFGMHLIRLDQPWLSICSRDFLHVPHIALAPNCPRFAQNTLKTPSRWLLPLCQSAAQCAVPSVPHLLLGQRDHARPFWVALSACQCVRCVSDVSTLDRKLASFRQKMGA